MIDFVNRSFLSSMKETRNQIVNLGAGFDSTFFRLRNLNLLSQTLFIEVGIFFSVHLQMLKIDLIFFINIKIDFPDVINRKINNIIKNENLLSLCPDLTKIQDINGNLGM